MVHWERRRKFAKEMKVLGLLPGRKIFFWSTDTDKGEYVLAAEDMHYFMSTWSLVTALHQIS